MTDDLCTKSSSLARSLGSSALKTSALVLLLVVTNGFAIAADQESNTNPCNVSKEDEAGLNGHFDTDVHATRNYMTTIAGVLKEEKFDELDCLADRARSNKERFPGGLWKLHTLYGGLYTPVQYPVTRATRQDWNTHLQHLQQWVASRPKSVTARVALAKAYLFYAYDARGGGYADTVSDSGWKLFGERTAQAKQILEDASALPTKCPEWYLDMLLVAQNQGWRASDARAVFDEGFKFEPGYFYNARVLANYLLPKWTREEGATERFTQEIADRIGGSQGDIFYFQVATAPDLICGCDEDPHLSMERIERGFEASEKQYGVSMLNLNLIAFLTTNYRDSDAVVAEKALARIREQWDEETWKTKQDFEAAKTWAATWAPVKAKEYAVRAAAEANMRTPEGARYKASFEKTYRELVQQCVRTDGSTVDQWKGKFETVASIGAKGTFEDGWIAWMGPVVMCLQRKIQTSRQEGSPLFPPPPQAPYWVKLDLDWADFTPVAAK